MFALITAFGLVLLITCSMELLVRTFVDDGMQYDLEMWKYARRLKRRSADPLIGHEHRPNTAAHLMGVDVRIRSQGLRDREFSFRRTPGVKRVLMLGDSMVLGWGVPEQATVCKRLERRFAAEGAHVEVINTGVGNYNSVQEAEYFLTKGFAFNPDLVVLNFFVNDAEPVPRYSANAFLGFDSEAIIFFVGRFDWLEREFGGRADWKEYYLALYQRPGWPAAQDYIAKLASYCGQHGIRLMIVSWPELHDVRHYQLQPITDAICETAKRNGLPFVDLLPAVKEQDSSKLWVTPPDPHPNSYANALFAGYLYPTIRQMLFQSRWSPEPRDSIEEKGDGNLNRRSLARRAASGFTNQH